MKKLCGVVLSGWFHACFVVFASLSVSALAQAQDRDQITAADMKGVSLQFTTVNRAAMGQNGTQQATLPGILGIDSIPNFSGAYSTPGFSPTGKPQSNWLFNMLGNAPSNGGTTMVNAPIVPVSLDFRNADGSERFVRAVNGRAIPQGIAVALGRHRTGCYLISSGQGPGAFL